MIDVHAHLTFPTRPDHPRPQLTAEQLVSRMDQEGIERAVLLPMESPDTDAGAMRTEDILEAVRRFPTRLIPFLHVDPRVRALEEQIEYLATEHGCRGYGEMLDGLWIDDPLHKRVYAKCTELGLPVLFDMNVRSCMDEPGLPRMETVLQEFPDCIFIGHGPCWWTNISADADGTGGYPQEPVVPGGAVERLLGEHDNMYADLSAGSGYNALTRDPEFTHGFIDRHWRKLMFGTDIVRPTDCLEIVQWMREFPLTGEQYQAIAAGTARRILGLDE